MPTITKTKITTKRRPRRYRRRRYMRHLRTRRSTPINSITIRPGNSPLPSRIVTTLKYTQNGNTATPGVLFAQLFNLNSVYDPDRTGTGHQPYGYDQLTALYQRYRVFAASWVFQGFAVDNIPVQFSVVPINNAALPVFTSSSQDLMAEMPRARWASTSMGTKPAIIRGHIYLPNLLGRTSAQYKNDDTTSALVSTDPVEAAILAVIGQDLGAAGIATAARWFITIKYHVEFFDPIPVQQS